jgi:hypothetical protein
MRRRKLKADPTTRYGRFLRIRWAAQLNSFPKMRVAGPIGLLGLSALLISGCLFSGRPSVARCEPHRAPPGAASTYYVNAARGRDSNPGTSPRQAWRTLARVGRGGYRGGATILLRGGQRFPGTICVGSANVSATTRGGSLTIRSYGGGRATIEAPSRSDGIAAINVGISVASVNLVGRRDVCNLETSNGYRFGTAGIRVEASGLHDTLAPGLTATHIDVRRFCDGIVIVSGDRRSLLAGVRVGHVTAHDNSDAGIWTYDSRARAEHPISNVRVTDTRVYRNGYRGGIMLFGVNDGKVTRSIAWANANKGGGGVGIWAFDSARIVFAHDEAFGNGSPSITDDGDGFDFDRGVSHSVMEDNYSHDNGGIGLLVCSCNVGEAPFYRMHHITLRSNVSRNDGSSGQPALYILGGEPMTAISILDNRVESRRGHGPLVNLTGCRCRPSEMAGVGSGPYTGLSVRGNTFIARGGKPLLERHLGPRATLDFRGNVLRAAG